jgi:hypothetical protein
VAYLEQKWLAKQKLDADSKAASADDALKTWIPQLLLGKRQFSRFNNNRVETGFTSDNRYSVM